MARINHYKTLVKSQQLNYVQTTTKPLAPLGSFVKATRRKLRLRVKLLDYSRCGVPVHSSGGN